MNRRAADTRLVETVARFGCSLIAVLVIMATPAVASAIEPVDEPPVSEPVTTQESEVTGPPVTANDFFPEERDVTDCVGVLERPGCGSESRGGWHQYAVLAAIGLGLSIVFFNVIRGVRNRNLS